MPRTIILKCPLGTALRFLPLFAAAVVLTSRSPSPPFQDLPSGGVDATTGSGVVDDIWPAGPHGLAAGADASLRLALSNGSSTTEPADPASATRPTAPAAHSLRTGWTTSP